MRYFGVVLAIFALLQFPALQREEWLTVPANQATLALAVGIFLSGIHHAAYVQHYVGLLPPRLPARAAQVYLSAALRMLFGVGLLLPATRLAATIGSLGLFCLVLPVNVRVAWQGNVTGQLMAAGWFLWLKVAVHLVWIGYCGWCLTLVTR